jgi:hypothetical protein
MMRRWIRIIRWIARIWSIPSIVALLLPYFVEGFCWLQATSLREVVGHLCFFAILVGLILAWFREGLGSALVATGFTISYVTWWTTGDNPHGSFLVLIAAPGLPFLLCWLLSRHAQQTASPGESG